MISRKIGIMVTISCDIEKCVECHACEVSCKAVHHLEPGVKWRWVESIWQGEFPNVKNHSISQGCLHCEDAPCVEACQSNAINQDPESGIVLVDSEKCSGAMDCVEACAYNVPQFGKSGKMQKCNLCFDLFQKGEEPVCVATCPANALELIIDG
jgi:Fe-S-cluster-containing dehydrogenase component